MTAAMPAPEARDAVHCSRCLHYWITHDRSRPYACRAFGIASARLPMIEVRESSGSECEAFEPRDPGERPR